MFPWYIYNIYVYRNIWNTYILSSCDKYDRIRNCKYFKLKHTTFSLLDFGFFRLGGFAFSFLPATLMPRKIDDYSAWCHLHDSCASMAHKAKRKVSTSLSDSRWLCWLYSVYRYICNCCLRSLIYLHLMCRLTLCKSSLGLWLPLNLKTLKNK